MNYILKANQKVQFLISSQTQALHMSESVCLGILIAGMIQINVSKVNRVVVVPSLDFRVSCVCRLNFFFTCRESNEGTIGLPILSTLGTSLVFLQCFLEREYIKQGFMTKHLQCIPSYFVIVLFCDISTKQMLITMNFGVNKLEKMTYPPCNFPQLSVTCS